MGRAALRPAAVSMNDLVQRLHRKAVGRHARARRATGKSATLPVVHADATFIQLALYNLLSNAVKFTGQQRDRA